MCLPERGRYGQFRQVQDNASTVHERGKIGTRSDLVLRLLYDFVNKMTSMS